MKSKNAVDRLGVVWYFDAVLNVCIAMVLWVGVNRRNGDAKCGTW